MQDWYDCKNHGLCIYKNAKSCWSWPTDHHICSHHEVHDSSRTHREVEQGAQSKFGKEAQGTSIYWPATNTNTGIGIRLICPPALPSLMVVSSVMSQLLAIKSSQRWIFLFVISTVLKTQNSIVRRSLNRWVKNIKAVSKHKCPQLCIGYRHYICLSHSQSQSQISIYGT